MSTTYRYRVIILTLLIILSLSLTAFAPSAVAYAADGSNTVNFDSTDVLDDLEGSALNGVPFDVANYPYNKNGEIAVLGFVEYCYSEYENLRGNYGLYLYLYNPALKDISESSNRIQMAVAYGVDGTPTEYNKFSLQYCGKSTGVEANRFWKFKVVGAEYFLDIVDVAARTYYVSGVEIWTYGDKTPVEIGVKTSYTWTGFADGYGSSGKSLNCTAEQSEGIDLEVKHTSYITGMSSLGNGHYNQINTAYFAVPNYYFDNYGHLQKIFAEWYEYKLKNMLVTSDMSLYQMSQQFTGYEMKNTSQDDAVMYSLYYGASTASSSYITQTEFEWVFNRSANEGYIAPPYQNIIIINDYASMIPLSFYSEVSDAYEIFDFLNKYKSAGEVDSNELLEEIYAYSNKLGHGYVDPTEKEISSDLFFDYVDNGRTLGFQQREVDFDDTFDLTSYDSNHGWWDKFVDFGWFGTPEGIDVDITVQPIYDVTPEDMAKSDDYISDYLYINSGDVAAFREYYNEYHSTHHIILFRFAHTDYFARAAGHALYDYQNGKRVVTSSASEENPKSYVCSETVFLNFDIISLTFNDDGEYRAFAVVSNPVDIVGALQPPADSEFAERLEGAGQAIKNFFNNIGDWFKNNWKRFVIGIAAVIALVLIGLFVKFIISIRGNKVNIHIDSPTASSKRSSSKKSPRRKT